MVPVGTKGKRVLQNRVDLDPNAARLMQGLAAAIAERGYASTTIADIVRHARVSKRTFYEHFPDKESCFLESYRAASEQMLATIAAAVDPSHSWDEQVAAATRAYIRALEENPELTRMFLLEIHAAGPRAIELRRKVHENFAEMLRSLVTIGRRNNPHIRPLSGPMATALVGGVNELVLVALERGPGANLRDIERTAIELVEAVLRA